MLLSFNVQKQIITRTDTESVVCNSMNFLYAQFTFSEEWTGTKTAVFKGKEKTYNALLDENDTCLVPWEVLTESWFYVSVFCGDLVTANKVAIYTIPSGYEIGDESRIPTPEIYNQIIEKLDGINAESIPYDNTQSGMGAENVQEALDVLAQGGGGGGGVTPNISMTASVDATTGTPDVEVTKTGTLNNPIFNLAFSGLKGEQGSQGPQGPQGPQGEGVPSGGATGQVLVKKSDSNNDTEWSDTLNEVGEVLDIQKRHYNFFDYTNIIDDYYRETALNTSIESRVSRANGWCSGQIWEVKKGDTIYTSTQWFGLLIYDENETLVEYASNSGEAKAYTITNDNAKYLTIQASAHNDTYLYKLMISINYPLPNEYHEYADIVTTSALDDLEEEIPMDGKAQIKKGFVVISFDDFNLSDNRFSIVNEYGFKASGSFSYSNPNTNVYNTLLGSGWDCHLYNGYNWPSDNSYYTDTPTDEIQEVWDNYIKITVDLANTYGIHNVTAWGARQGKSCVGLENACKKYGLKMIRGKIASNPHDRYQSEFNYSTASAVSLIPSKLNDAINACISAANNKYGLVFTTHGLYETTEEAEANYGLTESNLRQFLTAIKTLVDAGTLEVLTFSEVYRKYYSNDAADNDYQRIVQTFPIYPSAPSTDGTYTLQATVNNGVVTYSWV